MAAAREAHGAHRGLGARGDEADLLHRRDEPRDALGELDLGAAGGAVGGAAAAAPCGSRRATAFGMWPKRCGPYDMT